MKTIDLEIFKDMPFLFWVKDEEGKYLWGNRAIDQLARETVAGKTDYELPWAADADGLRAADKEVITTGKPKFLREYVKKPSGVTLNVCKWVGELDGKKRCFGISFVTEHGTPDEQVP